MNNEPSVHQNGKDTPRKEQRDWGLEEFQERWWTRLAFPEVDMPKFLSDMQNFREEGHRKGREDILIRVGTVIKRWRKDGQGFTKGIIEDLEEVLPPLYSLLLPISLEEGKEEKINQPEE